MITFLLNSFYINILIQQNKKFSDICFLFIANNKCDIYYNYSNNSNSNNSSYIIVIIVVSSIMPF